MARSDHPGAAAGAAAPKQQLAREKYEALIAAYRGRPAQHAAVAREVGVWHGTARRYWERGGAAEWALPIRGIIEGEQEASRALLQQEAETYREERLAAAEQRGRELGKADAEDAREDKRNSLRAKARITRATRENAIDFLEVACELLGATKELRDHVLDAIRTDAQRTLILADPSRGIALIRELSKIVSDAQTVAKIAIELEHMTLGDPSSGGATLQIESDEEAIVIIRRSADAVRRRFGSTAVAIDTTARDVASRHDRDVAAE